MQCLCLTLLALLCATAHLRKRLQKIISTMRERLEAKMGNQNNNAFKFRKLFQVRW